MLDLTEVPDDFLDPVARIVEAALSVTDDLSPAEVMVVGSWCRDILHRDSRPHLRDHRDSRS